MEKVSSLFDLNKHEGEVEFHQTRHSRGLSSETIFEDQCFELSGAQIKYGFYGPSISDTFKRSDTVLPHGCQHYFDPLFPSYNRIFST